MNPLEGLAEYLNRLERRLRLFTWTRGAAAIAAAALLLTVAIVALLMMAAFSPSGVLVGRFALFLGIGAAVAVALVIPLLGLNRRRAATEVEKRHPGFDQRLLTFTERSNANAADPFLPLLAEDALVIARDAQPHRLVENRVIIRFVSVAAAAASVLVWLLFWGPGVFGYGASLLWGSLPKDQSKPFYSISVHPGSKTIRRKTDLMVSAELSGFSASKANVFARYASSSKWEEAPMERQEGGAGFHFLFVGVPEDVDYYVEAGSLRSSTYKIHTVDLPAIKNIVVTYTYPSWTGMASTTEDPGGDLRAVEGTVAHLEIQTDRPLAKGQIMFEDGKPISLDPTENNKTRTTIPIQKDGTYHIAVMDNGEMVRLTDDYFIEARKPGVPSVRITKPGRDAKVTPIEEVNIEVNGEDENPLQELTLHYSVNGGAEKTVPMLKQKGAKQVTANTLLALEDYKLVPGDIVSLYATVRDGRTSARTDMFFIQAVPFEYNFSQSQQSGGGGAGGADQQEQQISDREKEIIAATFNQIKGDAKTKAAAGENGRYLSEVQGKLRDQAQSLANRMKARQLDGSGAGFQQFVKEMEAAVGFMSPASDKLKNLAFNDSLPPEQQALQHLLRAESVFRDIQISISRGGGGGGGGAAGGARDLANLFDLELDKDKNQYETSQNAAAEQRQQKIDDALKKLQELARRQQELAQQPQNPQQLAEQRYQQEMLRREAEQLRREMEQLQRGDQDQQGQQGQQQGQQSASNGGGQQSSQQSGQQRNQQQQQGSMARNNTGGRDQQANNEQLQQAIRSIEQATRDMSDSASARQPGQQGRQGSSQSQSEAQRAAERLKQAEQTIEAMRHQQNGSDVNNLASQAEQLAGRQQEFEQKMRQTFGQGNGDEQTSRQMAQEKQQLLDSYMQLQKGMQQTSRSLSGTQPDVSKQVRDALSRSEQSEVQSRMEWAEAALRQGMGQYAVMREALTTNSLNQLRDDLKKAEAGASAQTSDDKGAMATQQALNQAERIRREIEQLARGQQARANGRNGQRGQGQQQANGQQPGQQPGSQQASGKQSGGQQPGGNQQGGQQQASSQSGGQQSGGQQPGGQQSGGAQQGGGSPQGGGGNQGGARYAGGLNGGNLEGVGTWENRTLDGVGHVNPQSGSAIPTPAQAQVDYDNLIRDLGRLRPNIGNDRDLAREYQQLLERARQLDPSRWATAPQLAEVINNQVLSEIDEVELMLRRKAQANDGSVRGASPRDIPPGYSDAIAEYNRKLSKQ